MTTDRFPRRLAAILYADVAGYSRATGDDEDATHRTLSGHLDAISETVEQNGGRVMHYAGDAVLVMFDAVLNAVRAAVEMQNEVAARNAPLAEERKLRFRIGLNLGDVIHDRGDIYGDGVNVAARLEALADPDGICVSEAVRGAVDRRLPVRFEYLGEQRVKNIADPVRAYRVFWGENYSASAAETNVEISDVPSIAVLPMTNMGGDTDDDIFCDGIAEDIITALSKISKLKVVARNASFQYRGNTVDLSGVSHDLGVRNVMQGSLRRSGSRLRINAQLVDTTTGIPLWAERYDRASGDVFEIQDEITREITTALRVELSDGEQARVWARGTSSLEAWELTARGLMLIQLHHREDTERARALAERAVLCDEEYAMAHLLLGWSHWAMYFNGWTSESQRDLDKVLACVNRALKIDPETPDAYALLGLLHLENEQHTLAVATSERATELAPGHSFLLAVHAMILSLCDEPERALRSMEKAIQLCPIYPIWYLMVIARCHKLIGEYALAESVLNDAIQRDPDLYIVHVALAGLHGELNHVDEARRYGDQALRLFPRFTISAWQRGRRYRDGKRMKRETDGLRCAGLPD